MQQTGKLKERGSRIPGMRNAAAAVRVGELQSVKMGKEEYANEIRCGLLSGTLGKKPLAN